MDISILKEIDRITERHLESCPCKNKEIEEQAKRLALESVKHIESNNLIKNAPSVGLDIINQNKDKARELVADKYYDSPCSLQSEYASGLWNGFAEKYNIDNPQVSLIVGSIIVLALRAYKMSGQEIVTKGYDKNGNEMITLLPTIPESRKYLESLVKSIKTLDEVENGRKMTIRTELPDRKDLFGSSNWILIEEEEKGKDL
jgi:hypothetical protein